MGRTSFPEKRSLFVFRISLGFRTSKLEVNLKLTLFERQRESGMNFEYSDNSGNSLKFREFEYGGPFLAAMNGQSWSTHRVSLHVTSYKGQVSFRTSDQ